MACLIPSSLWNRIGVGLVFGFFLIPMVHAQAPLVPAGALWRYLDNGSDAGVEWRNPTFNDSSWSNGVAQFGYGDGDEQTVINGGPETNRFITTYFRLSFSVGDPADYTNLILRLLRDDGAIVYLNGVEVFRSNMPTGAVNYLTPAVFAVEDDSFHATNINVHLLKAGNNFLAAEVHQAGPTSDDVSFDLELLPNVVPAPPDVSLLEPSEDTFFVMPATVTINVAVTDFDSDVARIEFYDGTNMIGLGAADSSIMVVSNFSLGIHVLSAVATDYSGLRGTSAPVSINLVAAPLLTTLVATGSVWRYLDNGTDQGTAWRSPAFNDSGWASGAGELGYGDLPDGRPETTVICCSNATSHSITYYFRHSFTVANAFSFTNLAFRVMRDDGAVVYLNGLEVFRMNMPSGIITNLTPASTQVGGTNEAFYFPTNVSPSNLIEGVNMLAVEIHQNSATSTDVSFDLGLTAIAPPFSGPPRLSIKRSESNAVVSWPGNGYVLQQTATIGGPWTDLLTAASPYSTSLVTGNKWFRLRTH